MSDTTDAIGDMIAEIARGLIDEPDQVRVTNREDRDRIVFELFVPESQRGQVIGRGGRIAHALRAVTQAAGRANGLKVALDIVD